jgi:hypothetical protein
MIKELLLLVVSAVRADVLLLHLSVLVEQSVIVAASIFSVVSLEVILGS